MAKQKRTSEIPALIRVIREVPMEERKKLAEEAGTKASYIFQIAHGHRRASVALARRLEQVCDGKRWPKVHRAQLRPDIWSTSNKRLT